MCIRDRPVADQHAKFMACCASAVPPMPVSRAEALAVALRGLDELEDVRELVALMTVAG